MILRTYVQVEAYWTVSTLADVLLRRENTYPIAMELGLGSFVEMR